MRYAILIYVDPASYEGVSEAEQEAEMGEYFALGPSFRERGWEVTGEALQPIEAATTVRLRDGKYLVTDGPFAETKESFFSYIIIDVADLDAALGWAKRMPNATYGSVEVRPLSSHEQDA